MQYYVFDDYDCFGGFKTVKEAYATVEWMLEGDFKSVRIMYLSEDDFNKYCDMTDAEWKKYIEEKTEEE